MERTNKSKLEFIIGIDPGLTGAVTAMCLFRAHQELLIWDTPTITAQKGKSKKNQYVPHAMASILDDYKDTSCHVFIEKVHAMPGNGATSMFNFGYGFGLWVGIISALKMPVTMVPPQTWKKKIMQGFGDKEAAIIRACELYPDFSNLFSRKKDIGRADATLIAEYGRQILLEQ